MQDRGKYQADQNGSTVSQEVDDEDEGNMYEHLDFHDDLPG